MEELIFLAKQKGFYSTTFRTHPKMDKDLYYFWMCELQKWLREKYNLHVTSYRLNNAWTFGIFNIIDNRYIIPFSKEKYNTYRQSLEIGLKEAIILIDKKQLVLKKHNK